MATIGGVSQSAPGRTRFAVVALSWANDCAVTVCPCWAKAAMSDWKVDEAVVGIDVPLAASMTGVPAWNRPGRSIFNAPRIPGLLPANFAAMVAMLTSVGAAMYGA